LSDVPTGYRSELAARSDRIRLLEIRERRYLAIDGTAAPGGQAFQDTISTLYPVAYTLHFALRKRGIQAPVGALEGLFWIGEPGPMPIELLGGTPEKPPGWTISDPHTTGLERVKTVIRQPVTPQD
jgi:hypothetical protein